MAYEGDEDGGQKEEDREDRRVYILILHVYMCVSLVATISPR